MSFSNYSINNLQLFDLDEALVCYSSPTIITKPSSSSHNYKNGNNFISKVYMELTTVSVGADSVCCVCMEGFQSPHHNDSAKQKILNDCNKRSLEFSFIPPRAPHFGGL